MKRDSQGNHEKAGKAGANGETGGRKSEKGESKSGNTTGKGSACRRSAMADASLVELQGIWHAIARTQ